MNEAQIGRADPPTPHQPHRQQKMHQHTGGEDQLEGQQGAECRTRWCRQHRQIAQPDHADTCAEQHQQHPRHQGPGTVADALLHQQHDAGRQLLVHAGEDQYFKEHRADKHQRREQMGQQKQEIEHQRLTVGRSVWRDCAPGRGDAALMRVKGPDNR